jgi:nitroreductase
MDAIQAILSRRSIRDYTEEAVPEERVTQLLQAAMSAPSSKDSRPWHFIILNDRKMLNRIPLYFPYAFMIRRAPAAIIVCGDESKNIYGIYWTFDCAAASENIVVAANALGLGAVWCGVYLAEVPQKVDFHTWLGLPAHIIPFAVIPIGYPAEKKASTDRYDPTRVHVNKW